jgi:hypothetical protein
MNAAGHFEAAREMDFLWWASHYDKSLCIIGFSGPHGGDSFECTWIQPSSRKHGAKGFVANAAIHDMDRDAISVALLIELGPDFGFDHKNRRGLVPA